jgi:hypothetical protein
MTIGTPDIEERLRSRAKIWVNGRDGPQGVGADADTDREAADIIHILRKDLTVLADQCASLRADLREAEAQYDLMKEIGRDEEDHYKEVHASLRDENASICTERDALRNALVAYLAIDREMDELPQIASARFPADFIMRWGDAERAARAALASVIPSGTPPTTGPIRRSGCKLQRVPSSLPSDNGGAD